MSTRREAAGQGPADARDEDPLELAAEAQTLLHTPLSGDEISLMTDRPLAAVAGELARLAPAADCALAAVLAEPAARVGCSASGAPRRAGRGASWPRTSGRWPARQMWQPGAASTCPPISAPCPRCSPPPPSG